MAPFSWSRKQATLGFDDAAEGVFRVGEFFDVPSRRQAAPVLDEVAQGVLRVGEFFDAPNVSPRRNLKAPFEPGPRTSSLINHSRSSTLTSSLSFYEPSTSESSFSHASRPPSQQVQGDQGSSLAGKKTRGLFSKGSRLLRRQGSKFSMLSGQSTHSAQSAPSSEPTTSDDTYPPPTSPERVSRQERKESAAAVRSEFSRGRSFVHN